MCNPQAPDAGLEDLHSRGFLVAGPSLCNSLLQESLLHTLLFLLLVPLKSHCFVRLSVALHSSCSATLPLPHRSPLPFFTFRDRERIVSRQAANIPHPCPLIHHLATISSGLMDGPEDPHTHTQHKVASLHPPLLPQVWLSSYADLTWLTEMGVCTTTPAMISVL